jgi:hypothetical protein
VADTSSVLGEASPRLALKLRRIRRSRRLGQLGYWAAWTVGGLVFLLLLASGIAGFAAG